MKDLIVKTIPNTLHAFFKNPLAISYFTIAIVWGLAHVFRYFGIASGYLVCLETTNYLFAAFAIILAIISFLLDAIASKKQKLKNNKLYLAYSFFFSFLWAFYEFKYNLWG